MWSALGRALKSPLRGRRLRCSFCGRDEAEVQRLVAGASALICDECIHECVAVLREHGGFGMPAGDRSH
jgi:ATP-dependent Clp protease ATP-binding subunit ClpX